MNNSFLDCRSYEKMTLCLTRRSSTEGVTRIIFKTVEELQQTCFGAGPVQTHDSGGLAAAEQAG